MCHLILFAPLLALPLFLLPFHIALPAFGIVVGLTALLGWPALRALRRPTRTGPEGMVGARGEALTELNPDGLVRCQGEVWAAMADGQIPAGQPVRVVAVERLHVRVARPAR